jgi:signal peptidase I
MPPDATPAAEYVPDGSARDDGLAQSLVVPEVAARGSGDDVEPNAPKVARTPRARIAPEPGAANAPADEASAAAEGGAVSAAGDGTPPADPTLPRHGVLRRRSEPKKHKKAPWWELPVLIAVAIAVAVLIKTFLVQPFYIPSESMEKTLHGCPGCSGDRVLVNKLIFDVRDPHPGDIVVFRAPPNWDEEPTPSAPSNPLVRAVHWFGQLVGFVPPDEKDLIKRVIAVGGQSVQCCDALGRVQVSDHGPKGPWRSLDEPYIFENSAWDPRSTPGHVAPGSGDQRTFGPVTIPKGRLWVMGDHRGDSADSRYHCIEQAPADHICGTTETTVAVNKVIGKGIIIAWPPSRWRTLGTPATFKHTAEAGLPFLGGAALVLPVFGVRRRRRRL